MLIGQVYPVGPFEIQQECFALLALPLIWLYNGQHGRKNKGPATRRLRVLPRAPAVLWQAVYGKVGENPPFLH